jgi:hypothetical protein
MNNFATRLWSDLDGLKTEALNARHVPFDLNHAQLPHRSDNHRAALQIGADVAGVRGVLGVEWAKRSSAGATKKKLDCFRLRSSSFRLRSASFGGRGRRKGSSQ